ncbi:MAG: hypothetical protein V3S55_15575 [Nitrospiraceae bacterium]
MDLPLRRRVGILAKQLDLQAVQNAELVARCARLEEALCFAFSMRKVYLDPSAREDTVAQILQLPDNLASGYFR